MAATILIVDDDDFLVQAVRRLLERAGYDVIQAGDVAEARVAIGGKKPDLLLMDLVLPGMEGREVANLLVARHPGLPVVFMSGHESLDLLRAGQLAWGEGFLKKPFSGNDLLALVERVLARRERDDARGA